MSKERFLTVRVPADLDRRLDKLAKANDRTKAAEIRLAIRAHIEQEGSK